MAFCARALVALSVVTLTLGGCSPAPTVEYTKIQKPSDLKGDEIGFFFIQSSIIKIDKGNDKLDSEGKQYADMIVSSIPVEYRTIKFGIRRSDSIGVHTNLNISKRANTDLIQEIGSEVVDKRVELINTLGSIVKTAVSVAFSASGALPPSALPVTINVATQLSIAPGDHAGQVTFTTKDGVTVIVSPIPPDARPLSSFVSGTRMTGIIYAACRLAEVSFTYQDHNYRQSVSIADPTYYEYVGFPDKGNVTFHSECGVSVQSDRNPDTKDPAEVVDALVAQAKAIKDAIDAAKKKEP